VSTADERRILALATAFVVPSGAAALIYQVVWVRLLRFVAEPGRLDVRPYLESDSPHDSQLDALARYLFRVGEETMAEQLIRWQGAPRTRGGRPQP
jgi:hypothetical protein